jgi:hypothetical protein
MLKAIGHSLRVAENFHQQLFDAFLLDPGYMEKFAVLPITI